MIITAKPEPVSLKSLNFNDVLRYLDTFREGLYERVFEYLWVMLIDTDIPYFTFDYIFQEKDTLIKYGIYEDIEFLLEEYPEGKELLWKI